MIQIGTFKEKEKEGVEGRSQLGGQWKVPMFGDQWGNILFGGPWKVPNLVAFGRFQAWWPLEGERKTSFSTLFIFPPNNFYLNLIFY
jgi:hypothetical protein